jgi:hypothetical protein
MLRIYTDKILKICVNQFNQQNPWSNHYPERGKSPRHDSAINWQGVTRDK